MTAAKKVDIETYLLRVIRYHFSLVSTRNTIFILERCSTVYCIPSFIFFFHLPTIIFLLLIINLINLGEMQTLVRLLLLSNDRIQRKSDKMIALTMSGDAEKTVTDKKGQINFSF